MIAIFLFYNKAQGKQTWWVRNKSFLHCHVMVNNGNGYFLIELTSRGIDHHLVPAKNIVTILRNVKRMEHLTGYVCVWRKDSPKWRWSPLAIRSCNELSRFVAGVDIGFTFAPIHLYEKLLRYDNRRNYKVLDYWRRSNGVL